VRAADDLRRGEFSPEAVQLRTLRLMADSFAEVQRRISAAEANAQRWEHAYRRLKARPAVRMLSALARQLRRGGKP